MLVDQSTKQAALARLGDGRLRPLLPGVGLQRTVNPRAGLVPIATGRALVVWVIAVGALIAAIMLVGLIPLSVRIGLGLVIGGATSNLADRILRAGVIDFIVIGRWPTFNVADAALVAGVTLIIIAFL